MLPEEKKGIDPKSQGGFFFLKKDKQLSENFPGSSSKPPAASVCVDAC